jgi:sarcosine oxidase/L-pipecolate oxidase
MERHNLFTTHQHGFRKGRSCVTQLIEVLDDWTKQLDNRNGIDTIYLDFQKAFDTVPHQHLINKLQSYDICGNILGWIRDFLANRKQKVVINGTCSDWTTVTSGIPQGSVLDPILFTIYINDLPDVVQNVATLFADDTKVYAVVNKEEEQHSLQNDINNLVHWSDKWLLKFNK